HNVAGTAVCDDGIVIDLSAMRGVHVDPAARTAWVQGGALWGDVDHETQAHGLATPGGIVSHTGVAGLTLGGGIGWLMRKHGLTVDNLLAADVVTAGGERLRASEDEHPDLFWALKGGGGNFGVVTAFEFRLHPLGPTVLAGPIIWDASDAAEVLRLYRDFIRDAPDEPGAAARFGTAPAVPGPPGPPFLAGPIIWDASDPAEVLRFYRDFICDAPDELGTVVRFGTAPPFPVIPEHLHWRPVMMLGCCYAGRNEEGERLLRPLRACRPPLLDLLGPKPYTGLQTVLDTTVPHGWHYCWKATHLPELSDDIIDAIT